jgi:hypothetical protein
MRHQSFTRRILCCYLALFMLAGIYAVVVTPAVGMADDTGTPGLPGTREEDTIPDTSGAPDRQTPSEDPSADLAQTLLTIVFLVNP